MLKRKFKRKLGPMTSKQQELSDRAVARCLCDQCCSMSPQRAVLRDRRNAEIRRKMTRPGNGI